MGFRHVNKVTENGTSTNRTISFMLGYEYRRDRDGDGIPDSKARCPDEPEDRDGFEDSDGCPDPDNDGDGVADREDLCPDEPAGQHAEAARLRGCPETIATHRF
jgi:OmpA-OmpF porin, OOP family